MKKNKFLKKKKFIGSDFWFFDFFSTTDSQFWLLFFIRVPAFRFVRERSAHEGF
jgi:hypothetical protein